MTNILNEAEQAIFGERNQNYGHPRDNFTRTAALWSAHKGVEFSAQEVAEFMVLVKLSRLQNGYHRDSVVDIAGYAGTIERLQEPVDLGPAVPVDINQSRQEVGEPRRWDHLKDVPAGVQVLDTDGDRWKRQTQGARYWMESLGEWDALYTNSKLFENDCYGPFTEAEDLK
jgi:hypothetical protein